jgi:hypothetical protein
MVILGENIFPGILVYQIPKGSQQNLKKPRRRGGEVDLDAISITKKLKPKEPSGEKAGDKPGDDRCPRLDPGKRTGYTRTFHQEMKWENA